MYVCVCVCVCVQPINVFSDTAKLIASQQMKHTMDCVYYKNGPRQNWASYILTCRISSVTSRTENILHSALFTFFGCTLGFINCSTPLHSPSHLPLCFSSVAVKMTTARYRPTWELAVDPLVSCKLCLGEFPLEQMTTITQCQCVFCTLVSRTLYWWPMVELINRK